MITPKLYGRLGNQCFQIAAAIAHARKMGVEWKIPRVTNDIRYWPNYFLKVVDFGKITGISYHPSYDEPRHCYDPLPAQPNITLNGYFQTEKYWPTNDEKEEIGNALGFHCSKQDYIAIHVRRGDYVTHFPDKHPPLPMEYYAEAMNYFINKKGVQDFKIYTDDIDFILRSFFKEVKFDGAPGITISKHRDPLTDMRDMYNASGFIISNSTFSLFPALLRLDQPPTVAPAEARWFGPNNAHLETCDLMPERFIKI